MEEGLSILGLKDVKKPCMAQCLWFQLITSAVLLAVPIGVVDIAWLPKSQLNAWYTHYYQVHVHVSLLLLVVFSQFILRDKCSHINHCALLDGESAVEVSKTFGKNRDVILNSLR